MREDFMIVMVLSEAKGEQQNRLFPDTVQRGRDGHGAGDTSDHPEAADKE